jgi:hypothetical protein
MDLELRRLLRELEEWERARPRLDRERDRVRERDLDRSFCCLRISFCWAFSAFFWALSVSFRL